MQFGGRYRHARALGYRSGLEVQIAQQLKAAGVPFEYEPFRIPFTQPVKKRHYTPDVVLGNGIIVEVKGAFQTSDRQKHLMVQAEHPALDVRFVFSNPNQRISKQSKTTYGKWAEAKGFLFAKGTIPLEWLQEPPNAKSLAAIQLLQQQAQEK